MAAHRNSHIPWEDLTEKHQKQVLMTIASLHEFHQGCILLGKEVVGNTLKEHPNIRFLRNACFAYLHGYYCARGALLLPFLAHIGRPDLAESIVAVLERDVGGVDLSELISTRRNRDLAHSLYDMDAWIASLKGDPMAWAVAYGDLQRKTIALHVLLRKLYPDASQDLDDSYM